MKILYVSCHEVLEFDEVSLLIELGHDVFSTGTYAYPRYRGNMKRPGINSLPHYPEFERLASTVVGSGYIIPNQLIDWADVVIVMHLPMALWKNWHNLKRKTVIWRSIGQSIPEVERRLAHMRYEGMKIVRYSPKESNLTGFIGQDAMIRFYKDPLEFDGWHGSDGMVINITQSLKSDRSKHVHYREIMDIIGGFPAKIYGTSNENLGALFGGCLEWGNLKEKMKAARVMVYGGTWPAAYTLTFIEGWMTGIPMVCIGKRLAENISGFEQIEFYEIEDLITNYDNGFYSNSIEELREYIDLLLTDKDLAMYISQRGRKAAINHFGKEMIKQSWKEFLDNLDKLCLRPK